MANIESKSTRQEASITKWRDNKGIGTLNLVPGFGKTRIASLICDRVLSKNSTAIIVAIAPNEITYKNLKDHLPDTVICTSSFKVLNDLDYYKKLKIDLLIIDEIHKFCKSDARVCLHLESTFRLGLTGDKLPQYSKAMITTCKFPIIDTITEEEALDNNWISDFVEYNIGVDIEEHKIPLYVAFSEKITEITSTYKGLFRRLNTAFGTKVFESDMDLMYALYSGTKFKTGYKSYQFLSADMIRGELANSMGWTKDMDMSVDMNRKLNQFFNPGQLQEISKVFNSIIRDRNNLIINSRNKTNMVLEIIARNPEPTIIFNESTDMCSNIANALGSDAIEYHSNVEAKYITDPQTGEYFCHQNGNPIKFGATRLKNLAIEGIKNGLFKYIVTVKSLNEGVDIPILSQVITTGGTTNPSTHIQRAGRGKRVDHLNPNKITKIINVYIKDFIHDDTLVVSRDCTKLKLRQADTAVYWVDNISDIFSESV